MSAEDQDVAHLIEVVTQEDAGNNSNSSAVIGGGGGGCSGDSTDDLINDRATSLTSSPATSEPRRGLQVPAFMLHMSVEERRELEARLKRKIDLRLMPAIIIMYILNYIDRYVGCLLTHQIFHFGGGEGGGGCLHYYSWLMITV